ncbi:MAG: hypothetical protein WBF90_04940 [Rivularia sp. (in: cyanobacteria)]
MGNREWGIGNGEWGMGDEGKIIYNYYQLPITNFHPEGVDHQLPITMPHAQSPTNH